MYLGKMMEQALQSLREECIELGDMVIFEFELRCPTNQNELSGLIRFNKVDYDFVIHTFEEERMTIVSTYLIKDSVEIFDVVNTIKARPFRDLLKYILVDQGMELEYDILQQEV